MREQIEKLLNSDITGYRIFKDTGMSQSIISEFRSGKRNLDNLSLKNAEKLYNLYNKLEENKMIKWTGKNTSKTITYTAEAETYEELYRNIQEKYGYDNIIARDAFEFKVLEINGENVDDWGDSDGITDWEAYEDWVTDDKIAKLTEEDYRAMINDSDAQAYYHEFEEVSEWDER